MSLRAFVGKEVRWGRRHLVALLLVLVVLPALFAYTAVLFQEVVPRDAPVAMVPGSDGPSDQDMSVARSTFRLFAHPVDYDSRERAFDDLANERVYAVVVVPDGLTAEEATVTVDVYIDARIVPYRDPSRGVVALAGRVFDDQLDANVRVERHELGREIRLSEYLLPTFLLGVLWTIALTYLPHTIAREAEALDRVRVQSSLAAYATAKLAAFTMLAAVPIAVFGAAGAYLGFDVLVLSPGVVGVALASFLALGAVAVGVTFLTRFSTTGLLANVVLLVGLLTLSGLAYPAGFFSPTRRELVRLLPTHYAAVLVRNAALKGTGPGAYPTAVLVLAGFVVGSLVLAGLSLRHYRRTAG